MRDAIDRFLLLCRCLGRPGSPAAAERLRSELKRGGTPWQALVELANHHFLTPALWQALTGKDLLACVPDDLCEFLNEAHRLNLARNADIKVQVLEATAALNRAGIEPVLLKGAVHLFAGDTDRIGSRMMRDVDLLVRDEQIRPSVTALKALGYNVVMDWVDWTYHYPVLGRPHDPACIELHRDVGEQRTLLSVEAAYRDAAPLDTDGLTFRALSPTHRVLHNLFHAQIQDRHHTLGSVALKDLHDLGLLLDGHAAEIDWAALRRALNGHGLGPVLDAYLYQADRLLGLPIPSGERSTRRAQWHYRRCLAQMGRPRLASVVSLWAALTHPFQRWRIDYHYGDTGNPLRRNFNRLRRLGRLLARHKWRIADKVGEIRHGIYSRK